MQRKQGPSIALIKENHPQLVYFFFAAYLLIGLCIFKDYGISYDECQQRIIGQTSVQYAVLGDKGLLTFRDRWYGPAFEMLLISAENVLSLFNPTVKNVFLMRHLLTFLLFYLATIFFYLLCKDRFQSWKMGLVGSLFLILSPRIFADSFYNSKDIVFLSVFVISIYTLKKYLKENTYPRALIHAIVTAILIDIRIPGIMLVVLTFIFWSVSLRERSKLKVSTGPWSTIIFYVIAASMLTILFWPFLWNNPVGNFIETLKLMAHFDRSFPVLYQGQYWDNRALPWHYAPIWIAITTPLSYVFLFIVGLGVAARSFLKKQIEDALFLGWFLLPLASVILLKSTLYDGWRHLFFVYPAFLIIVLIGLEFLLNAIKPTAGKVILIALIVFNLAGVLFFMVKYHPYQNVYFNRLAGRSMETVKNNYEMDYWGLSYRKALEYILEHDHSSKIKIRVDDLPGMYNMLLLDPEQLQRIQNVKSIDEATYFVTNFRWCKEATDLKEEFYSIKVEGAEIMTVYRVH